MVNENCSRTEIIATQLENTAVSQSTPGTSDGTMVLQNHLMKEIRERAENNLEDD